MLTKLKDPVALKTYKGKAWAVALIDNGSQCDMQWVTFLHNSGQCWTFFDNEVSRESL